MAKGNEKNASYDEGAIKEEEMKKRAKGGNEQEGKGEFPGAEKKNQEGE